MRWGSYEVASVQGRRRFMGNVLLDTCPCFNYKLRQHFTLRHVFKIEMKFK